VGWPPVRVVDVVQFHGRPSCKQRADNILEGTT
jgi:hypothetical protein